MTPDRTRRLSAVWFADIVGYTDLSSRDEAGALAVVDCFQRLVRETAEANSGRIVKFLGDGALVEFPSVDSAVRSALSLRNAFASAQREDGRGTQLRMGLHLGEFVMADDGDMYGGALNIAARIEAVAIPGEILVSDTIFGQIQARTEYATLPRGTKKLKGLSESIDLFSVYFAGEVPEQAVSSGTTHDSPGTPDQRFGSPQDSPGELSSSGPVRSLSTGRRPGRHVVPTVVLGIVAVGVASWLVLDDQPAGRLATDRPSVLAVLPFETSGDGLDELGGGMVDLLSAKLDGVGGIEVVPPRSVHHQWRAEVPDEGVNFQASLDLARGLGAGSAIVGSIVSTGTEVWLSGTLVNVSGRRVAEETVSGAREQLLRLVDSLAIQLVRATWSVQEPVPRLRVSALTTGSLPAARAYLRGERHYRSLEWDSAIVALEEAIGRDSTFALAYHRLSEALNWRDGFSQAGAAAESQAVTHIDRLPVRDQTIIRAKMLDRRGDLASIDTMRA